MGHEDKRAKYGAKPAPEKRPRISLGIQCPTVLWSFAKFDNHSWSDSAAVPFVEVAKMMRDVQGRPWREIEANRKRDHPVPTDHLIPDAQRRLAEIKQDDIDELWRLRCSGTIRIWGIRDLGVFHVLWWDPDHIVCPSELKNT